MSASDDYAQTAKQWIFVAKSLAQTAGGQDQALRCMARAMMRAENVNDWVATAKAWHTNFADPEMARECLGKAEVMAEETGDCWDEITEAWAGMKNFRRVVDIFREVHVPRPWPRLAEIESQGPLPPGTTVLDWIEPGEIGQSSRQAVENADDAMENQHTLEAIECLIDAENLADGTGDYLRVARRWRDWFPELEEFRIVMDKAEEAVDTPNDWVRIALTWKNDYEDYDYAVECMSNVSGGTAADWEHVLRTWKDDFEDPENFRHALNQAYGDVESFEQITSMVLEELDAYGLIERATLADLGPLTERTTSRVAAWDKGYQSKRRPGSLAGHFQFFLGEATEGTIFLTSDADNYLYLIQGEDPNGPTIAVDQDEGDEPMSLIKFNLNEGNYTIEATTDQVDALGIFHLQIFLRDENVA